jgi:hypothetical protein
MPLPPFFRDADYFHYLTFSIFTPCSMPFLTMPLSPLAAMPPMPLPLMPPLRAAIFSFSRFHADFHAIDAIDVFFR